MESASMSWPAESTLCGPDAGARSASAFAPSVMVVVMLNSQIYWNKEQRHYALIK